MRKLLKFWVFYIAGRGEGGGEGGRGAPHQAFSGDDQVRGLGADYKHLSQDNTGDGGTTYLC